MSIDEATISNKTQWDHCLTLTLARNRAKDRDASQAGRVDLVHLVDLVCFVYLVDLVHLVSFVQPKNQTN